jgi:hypothetical protein
MKGNEILGFCAVSTNGFDVGCVDLICRRKQKKYFIVIGLICRRKTFATLLSLFLDFLFFVIGKFL